MLFGVCDFLLLLHVARCCLLCGVAVLLLYDEVAYCVLSLLLWRVVVVGVGVVVWYCWSLLRVVVVDVCCCWC